MLLESPHAVKVDPTVGAILNLDTELEVRERFGGNRHWRLDGSCVLIAPDRILTTRHAIEKLSETAVFLPFEGLFPLESAIVGEKNREPLPAGELPSGDYLGLVYFSRETLGFDPHLARVEFTEPQSHQKAWKSLIKRVTVVGYGSWPGSRFDSYDGIQQQHQVSIRGGSQKLDLSWSARQNNGRVAGRNNSGGPMLWLNNRWMFKTRVVGIMREAVEDEQAGSWIGRDRNNWLNEVLSAQRWRAMRNKKMRHRMSLVFQMNEEGAVLGPYPIVALANGQRPTRVQATLSATPGLRLQMGFSPPVASDDTYLGQLEEDAGSSGRFLFRQAAIDKSAESVVVGVVPVASAARRPKRVWCQLSLQFS